MNGQHVLEEIIGDAGIDVNKAGKFLNGMFRSKAICSDERSLDEAAKVGLPKEQAEWLIHRLFELKILRSVKYDLHEDALGLFCIYRGVKFYIHHPENDFGVVLPMLESNGKDCEEFELEWAENFLREGDAVVDVGANIGRFSVFAAKRVGKSGKVVAIEPCPNNFQLLRKNMNFPEAAESKMYHFAAGRPGVLNTMLHLSKLNLGDHRCWYSKDEEHRETICIPVISIDGLNLGSVQLMKIDTQGFEHDVLLGSVQTIGKSRRMALFLEWWPFGLRGCGYDPSATFDLLKRLGFDRFYVVAESQKQLHKVGELPIDDSNHFCNVICLKG